MQDMLGMSQLKVESSSSPSPPLLALLLAVPRTTDPSATFL